MVEFFMFHVKQSTVRIADRMWPVRGYWIENGQVLHVSRETIRFDCQVGPVVSRETIDLL